MILILNHRLRLRHTTFSKKIVRHMRKRSRTLSGRIRRLEEISALWLCLFLHSFRMAIGRTSLHLERGLLNRVCNEWSGEWRVPTPSFHLSGESFLVIMKKSSFCVMWEDWRLDRLFHPFEHDLLVWMKWLEIFQNLLWYHTYVPTPIYENTTLTTYPPQVSLEKFDAFRHKHK